MGAYRPATGYGQNPLVASNLRNFQCPCMSGRKVKKCCGRIIYIPEKYLADLGAWARDINQGISQFTSTKLKNMLREYREADQQNLIINQGAENDIDVQKGESVFQAGEGERPQPDDSLPAKNRDDRERAND